MGEGYTPTLPRRWRTLLVTAAIVVTVPLLAAEPVLLPPVAGRLVAVPLVLAQVAALWWFAARPRVCLAVVLVASAGLQVLFPVFGPGLLFVMLCAFAWLLPAAETVWGLAAALVAACGPAAARGHWGPAALWAGAVALAWSWGSLGRASGARRFAERRQAVLEERARIARELHDVLSHTVSVMVVQAAAADDVFDVDPRLARQALRRTEQAGRQALTELRWFLRTVRADGGDDTAPQPTLDDVGRLVETVSEAGLPVTLTREGSADDVPPVVQLGAYRIVQEALTNTLRHAGASRAEVLIRVTGSEVFLRVRDDGRGGGPPTGTGQGIVGMRERADLVGGQLLAGPHAGGGFEVTGKLPLREPA